MKTCTRCKRAKELSEFHKRSVSKDGLQPHCKVCEKEKHRSQYLVAKDKIIARTLSRRSLIVARYNEWRSNQSCSICSEDDEACLDMHHLDPNEKEYSLGQLARDSFDSSMWHAEMKKCIIVCANCHRKIHKHGLEVVKNTACVTER